MLITGRTKGIGNVLAVSAIDIRFPNTKLGFLWKCLKQ